MLLVAGLAVSTASSSPAQAGPALGEVLVLGDSLAVGLRPYLGEMLPDRALTFNVRHGRTTPDGLGALHHELEHMRPQTIVVSLGTNDGPSSATFSDRIHRALGAIPATTCIVWTAVIRAPRKGPYGGLNKALRSQARHDRRLTVVNWDRIVSKGTVTLPDGIHPDAQGFRFRSWVIAAAVRRGCEGAARPA